jgi:hypothetical protein
MAASSRGIDGAAAVVHDHIADGEQLDASLSVVVATVAGAFHRSPAAREGASVEPGTMLGDVAGEAVIVRCAGALGGLLAVEGERVAVWQPIAWIRTA